MHNKFKDLTVFTLYKKGRHPKDLQHNRYMFK